MGNYVRNLGRSQRNLRVSPGSTGSTSSTRARNRRAYAHSGPHPQRRPKRRPPLPKPPKNSHCGRGGLRFGQIAGEGHPHQHATADTTLTTEWTAPHPSARSDCRHHLGDTTPVPPTATRTHRLLTARIRIGYEDMDRLLTYPDADNLSTSDTDTRATLTSEPPSKPRRAARHNDLLKLQTTSTKTSKKQPLWPRWSTFWDIDEIQVPTALKQRLPHTLQSLRRPRTPAVRYVCSAARSMSMEARR